MEMAKPHPQRSIREHGIGTILGHYSLVVRRMELGGYSWMVKVVWYDLGYQDFAQLNARTLIFHLNLDSVGLYVFQFTANLQGKHRSMQL